MSNPDFSELSSLYKEVKQVVLLAENLNSKQEVILSSLNEMRNAFDHLMRCYNEDNDTKYQIDKAKAHLYRAGYDAYELLAMDCSENIKNTLNNYELDIISKVFPEYFAKYLPKIHEIDKKLGQNRANRDITTTTNEKNFFDDYAKLVNEALDIRDEVISKVNVLADIKTKHNKEATRRDIKNIVIGIISGGILTGISYYFIG